MLSHRYYKQDYEKSLTYINRAIKIKSDFDTSYFQRGNVNMALGNYFDAISDFSVTIKLNPKYAEAYYYRALIQGGDYGSEQSAFINLDKACSDIKKYMELSPSNVDHYRDRFCK